MDIGILGVTIAGAFCCLAVGGAVALCCVLAPLF
jgi:hypothetical protein